jgi:hypothetical protein
VAAPIEAGAPTRWPELEVAVARILAECGYDVEVQKRVQLARGDVSTYVWADEHSSPPNVIAIECKLWSTPVTKTVVHAFRTVVGDSGANTGLIVAGAGFQDGATEAAAYSNVRLLTWVELQAMFVKRWYRRYMPPHLLREGEEVQANARARPPSAILLRHGGRLGETAFALHLDVSANLAGKLADPRLDFIEAKQRGVDSLHRGPPHASL